MADLILDPRTGEMTLDTDGEIAAYIASQKKEKKPKKQLRKRGLKPFDFQFEWGDTTIKCILPPDYSDVQDRQRQLIEQSQELQVAAKGDNNGALVDMAQSSMLTILDQGADIAKLTIEYSYYVVFKCVASWSNGPWEFNKDTWAQDVFDLESEDVQELATEISQRAILTKAEADFLAQRSFR